MWDEAKQFFLNTESRIKYYLFHEILVKMFKEQDVAERKHIILTNILKRDLGDTGCNFQIYILKEINRKNNT